MKKIQIFIVFLLISNPYALKAEETLCEDTIDVGVNGLVCDFCARALEKVFSKKQDVKSINVDFDKSLVQIFMKPEKKLDDKTITTLVTDAGYNVTSIKASCDKI